MFDISLAEWSLHRALYAKQLDHLDFPKSAKNDYGIDAVEYVNAFWARKGDGAYDLVLFTRDVKKGAVDAAYTLDKTGDKVTFTASAGASLVQPERVTKNPKVAAAIRDAFTRLVDSATEKEREKAAQGKKK